LEQHKPYHSPNAKIITVIEKNTVYLFLAIRIIRASTVVTKCILVQSIQEKSGYTTMETYCMDIASPGRLHLGLGVEVLDLQPSTLIVGAVGGTCHFTIATAARHPDLHVKLTIGRSTKLLRRHV
jgi:hypothetical protein